MTTRPGVATLAVATLLTLQAPAFADPLAEAIRAAVDHAEPRVVRLRYFGDAGDSLGASGAPVSGLVLDSGWVLTSLYGLTEPPAAIVCRLADGEQRNGVLAGRDFSRGLALVRLDGAGDEPPPLEGRSARVGETAIALGRVYDEERANVAVGIVSAVGRLGGRALQTDAAVSPANYGGPLVALDGSPLGLVTPLAPVGQSGVGLYDGGVGFAVPVRQINERLKTLAAGEEIRSGWLGLSLPRGDPLRTAAELTGVREDGPASEAGLAKGDVVTALAGRPTPTVWALRAVAGGLDAGRTVEGVAAGEGGVVRVFELTPAERPKDEPAELAAPLVDLQKEPDGR